MWVSASVRSKVVIVVENDQMQKIYCSFPIVNLILRLQVFMWFEVDYLSRCAFQSCEIVPKLRVDSML